MRAAVFTDYGEPLEVRNVDEPSPEPDGAVVAVDACGICRSDWHAWMGDWTWRGVRPEAGHVLGHEPAGRVVEVGEEVDDVEVGTSVAVPFNLGDGTCHLCRNGHSNVCENRMGLGFTPAAPGAWAEYVHVPAAEHNLVALPSSVSPVEMAGLGCRYMTAFHALAHRADVRPGDWLAVHGCGGIGLSAVQIGSALGANVVAVDLKAVKLRRAEDLGADEVVDADAVDDVPGAVAALTDGGAHVSVDALGIPTTCRNSIQCLRTLGQHVQIGLTTAEEDGEITVPSDLIVLREIEYIGSLGMQPPRYDELFRLIGSGTLDPSAIVSDRVGLEDVSGVLDDMTTFDTVGIPVITRF